MRELPVCEVPEVDLLPPATTGAWGSAAALGPLVRSDGAGGARYRTMVRLAACGGDLAIRFECEDDDAWGTMTRRDDPLWEEEVVEVFLAPGEGTPARYFEFEVSPLGTLLDACVENSHGDRSTLVASFEWNCSGVRWSAQVDRSRRLWTAELVLPLRALVEGREPPALWRGNFYRIDRPRPGEAEFSAWSPTGADPPDFHRPAAFGRLILPGPR